MFVRPVTAVAVALICAAPVVRAAESPTLAEQAAARVAADEGSGSRLDPELGVDGRRTTDNYGFAESWAKDGIFKLVRGGRAECYHFPD